MTGTYLYRRDFFRHSVTNKKKTQETQWWNAEGFKCFLSLMVLILQLSGNIRVHLQVEFQTFTWLKEM